MKIQILVMAIIVLVLGQISAGQQRSRTIFLALNAEKASNSPDAALSAAGQQRSVCLANSLATSAIHQVFVNESKAAQQTADPLAKALHIHPSIIQNKDSVKLVRNLIYGAEGNALVVSDRTTLPVILARLQGGSANAMSDSDTDRVYVVTVVEGAGVPAVSLQLCSSGSLPAKKAPAVAAKSIAPKAAVKKQ